MRFAIEIQKKRSFILDPFHGKLMKKLFEKMKKKKNILEILV